jgi:hypothetical protein
MANTIPGNEMEQLNLQEQHIRNDDIAHYSLDIFRLATHAEIEENVLFMAKTFIAGEMYCSQRKHVARGNGSIHS